MRCDSTRWCCLAVVVVVLGVVVHYAATHDDIKVMKAGDVSTVTLEAATFFSTPTNDTAAPTALPRYAKPFTLAAPWTTRELARCLRASSKGGEPPVLYSFGDSHGRQLIESVLQRTDPSLIGRVVNKNKRMHFVHDVTAHHERVLVAQSFRSYMTAFDPDVRPRNMHVVLSRGAWDALKRSTALDDYYHDIMQTLLGIAVTGASHVGSVSWRVLHYFGELKYQWQQPCASRDVIDAYRRVGACAVAAFNRDVVPWPERYFNVTSGGNSVWRTPVMLIDAVDLIEQLPLDPDGQHLGYKDAGLVMDAILAHTVCPKQKIPAAVAKSVLITSNFSDIAREFQCEDVWSRLPRNGAPTPLVAGRGAPLKAPTPPPPVRTVQQQITLPLEQYFGLRERYNCRCFDDAVGTINDQCLPERVLNQQQSAFENHLPFAFRKYVCELQSELLKRRIRIGAETNLSAVLLNTTSSTEVGEDRRGHGALWLAEIMLETCLAPASASLAYSNAGVRPTPPLTWSGGGVPVGLCGVPDDAISDDVKRRFGTSTQRLATPWCRRQRARLKSLMADINLIWRLYLNVSRSHQSKSPNRAAMVDWSQDGLGLEVPLGVCQHNNTAPLRVSPFVLLSMSVVCHVNWAAGIGTNNTAVALAKRRNVMHFNKLVKVKNDVLRETVRRFKSIVDKAEG